MTDSRRRLPSVSALLDAPGVRRLLAVSPRSLVVNALRAVLDELRVDGATPPASEEAWADHIAARVARLEQRSLRPVINATGVVLHTNLGRAPLAGAAIAAIADVARGYSNLEYDLDTGGRGSRYSHCASLLVELTGAEDALVVNNGAAALVLALATLSTQREAVVSRGELVEIGGSFRVPDIMRRSGAMLREVGTTNRTHLEDYASAIGAETGALVKVHRSNFAMEGFVAEVDMRALAALGVDRGVPTIHDLGSGLLVGLEDLGLRGEPTAADAIAAGATLVTMSGDKLLGGPQAGLIVGRRAEIAALRSNPLTRAFRVDKMTLAALEATLALYRDPARARRDIPTLARLSTSVGDLRARADAIRNAVGDAVEIVVVDSAGSVGGGAFPTAMLPSVALAVAGRAAEIERTLRAGTPAVIGRVADDRLLLDLRAVDPGEDQHLIGALRALGAA